ncbi:MAG: tetratricopeptide repeat protein [Planctomycetota bacterium]
MPPTDPNATPPAPPNDPTWVLLKDAVADALELAPDRWPDALTKALQGDADLIKQATAMLRAASGSTAQLHPKLDAYVGNDGPDPYALLNKDIGGYTVERLIAEGGMGAVYAAQQAHPKRTVALKVLRPGSVADSTRMRFGREVTALGRLKHPNIAQIYDAGVYRPAEGSKLPYLAMEYVDGSSLTDYARNHTGRLDEQLTLMIKVADAVHAAHQQAIIHRDLKPANILVDRDGEPKVLDFGIARLADENSIDFTSHTATGAILGTLAYMSPEQVTGNASAADARADVYAMGVMLYEIVMGKPPVDVKNQPLPVALQRISEDRTISLGPNYDSDLQTIIATAMEHDPARRYGSASELAADLRRYLANDPIAARPPTTRYLLTKFAQRHRGPLFAAVAFVLLLIGATAFASVGFLRAESQRKDAVAARDDAEAQRTIAEGATAEALLQRNIAREREREAQAARALAATERDKAIEEQERAESATAEALAQSNIAREREREAQAARALAATERDKAIEAQERAEAINQFLNQMLGAADPEELGRGVTLLETIDVYLGQVETTFAGQPRTRAEIYTTLGWVYFSVGDYGKAKPILQNAIALYEQTLGRNAYDTLIAVNHLSSVYDESGDYDALAELLDDRLPAAIASLGRGNDAVLHLQMMKAALLDHRGQYPEADAQFKDTIETAQESLGPTHPLTLTYMNNYSGFLIEQDQYGRAEALLRTVVKHRQADPDASIQDRAVALSNLASVIETLGRYDEAEAIYNETIPQVTQALGEEHTTTMSLMMAHATTLMSLGRADEACALSQRVVELRREHFGPDHIDTMLAMNNYAVQLGYAGRHEEGVAVAQTAYEGALAQLGSAHPLVWQAEQNYAVALSNVDRSDEALPLLKLGLERLEATLGDTHPKTIIQANNYAMTLFELGRNAEALLIGEACIRSAAQTLPDPVIAQLHRNAGRYAMADEQFELAEQHLLTSYEMLLDEPGGVNRRRTAMFTADLYAAWGKPEREAEFRAISEGDE